MTADSPPSLHALAAAALALLARQGGTRATCTTPDGPPLEIGYRGPWPAAPVPDRIVAPGEVPRARPWVGAQRLTVKAPLLVFDIAWNADEPLRIMTFSRGDWETHLLTLAQ
jgi:hypothetical protein